MIRILLIFICIVLSSNHVKAGNFFDINTQSDISSNFFSIQQFQCELNAFTQIDKIAYKNIYSGTRYTFPAYSFNVLKKAYYA